jgi:hypothetical protein
VPFARRALVLRPTDVAPDFLAVRRVGLAEAFLAEVFLDAAADRLAAGLFFDAERLFRERFAFGFPLTLFVLVVKDDTAPPTALPAVITASLVTSKPVAATPAPALTIVTATSFVTSRPVAATSSPALVVSTIASLAVERTPSRSLSKCASYKVGHGSSPA